MLSSVVIMGVAGSGKSTVARLAAKALGLPLVEGDAFHDASNVAKMRGGQALTDEDRQGWLDALAESLRARAQVLSCSALKRAYRERLRAASPGLRFVFLDIAPARALARVQARGGHFFSDQLVGSQFATLEPPLGESGVLHLDALIPPEQIAQQILAWWHA
jgi:gluconokinase